MALKHTKRREGSVTNPDHVRAVRFNCLVFIFRLIVATGCFLLDGNLHATIFQRLGFGDTVDYERIKGRNRQPRHIILYDVLIENLEERVNDCIRDSYYEIDIPLVTDYPGYYYTLPRMLKPLGIDGVVFYYDRDEREFMIFSGPDNRINIEYVARSPGSRDN